MPPKGANLMPEHKHDFDTPMEAAEYSLKRASEVQFEPVMGEPVPLKGDSGEVNLWPDYRIRNEFALALLTDAVRLLVDHMKESNG